jgi:hypothetical protein
MFIACFSVGEENSGRAHMCNMDLPMHNDSFSKLKCGVRGDKKTTSTGRVAPTLTLSVQGHCPAVS